jgi:hypothetical protein
VAAYSSLLLAFYGKDARDQRMHSAHREINRSRTSISSGSHFFPSGSSNSKRVRVASCSSRMGILCSVSLSQEFWTYDRLRGN